jgi:hypothetical protein
VTSDDPELGRVRWCNRCQEWWPDDEEFWRYYRLPAGRVTKVIRGRAYLRKSDSQTARCRACYPGIIRERKLAHA